MIKINCKKSKWLPTRLWYWFWCQNFLNGFLREISSNPRQKFFIFQALTCLQWKHTTYYKNINTKRIRGYLNAFFKGFGKNMTIFMKIDHFSVNSKSRAQNDLWEFVVVWKHYSWDTNLSKPHRHFFGTHWYVFFTRNDATKPARLKKNVLRSSPNFVWGFLGRNSFYTPC